MDRVDGHESVMMLPASWYLTKSPGLGRYPVVERSKRLHLDPAGGSVEEFEPGSEGLLKFGDYLVV